MHIFDAYVRLWITTAHHISFLLNRFSVKNRFPFPTLRFLTVKSPQSVTKRSVSQENAFKKSKNPSVFSFFFFFFLQNYRIKYFFYSNWKQFQVFKIAKFELKVTVHCGLLEKAPSCDSLTNIPSEMIKITTFKNFEHSQYIWDISRITILQKVSKWKKRKITLTTVFCCIFVSHMTPEA